MNIFYLSDDPIEAAQMMVDRHVVKMILESAQLLSTAHRVMDGEEQTVLSEKGRKKKVWKLHDAREPILYSATHINHPSAVWCRQSVENYNWLVDHMFALMDEYTYRYDKRHKCQGELSYMLQSPPKNLKDWDMTPIACAMDDKYVISDDPVINYRNYYKTGKTHLHSWKNREVPSWIVN
jgi:hypothetical protein